MTMAGDDLQFEHANGERVPATLEEVNIDLARYAAGVWPLDLSNVPSEQRRLLDQTTLSERESAMLLEHFVLPRERLLGLIDEAGREAQVPGGGEMSTLDVTHGVQYPEIYLVAPDADYSRFDRLHVNHVAEGTGVDETLQLLSGSGVRFVLSRPDVGTTTVLLQCPARDCGWTVSYSGAHPHIASFTNASEGTKVLMQIIGPPRWNMEYVEDEAARGS
jgi:hypothetical protein